MNNQPAKTTWNENLNLTDDEWKKDILSPFLYHRVIALISANIVPSWDIEGREQ